jgi:hypothetical protein
LFNHRYLDSKTNSDFIGLVTALMYENFTREVFVANMMRMPGKSHTAEYIKEAIETMITNIFSFKYLNTFFQIIFQL